MTNAERILQALDRHLDHEVTLVVYGRAAIVLGFDDPPEEVKQTLDVDVIIPLSQVERLSADKSFWDAQARANCELEEHGLYLTHLFAADQVFLRRDWERFLVPLARLQPRWLRLFRPATVDLILTKMMRGNDPQDMAEVEFLIRHDKITPDQIEAAFAQAVIPCLQDLQVAFEQAKPIVRGLATKQPL